ncbi:MAG: prepilin peptidase [Acidobacteriota bacterium]|nr:prepilin peptidase [Acidobacteriota bacterium]
MRIFFTILAGLLGLAFGSFLNVCLSRWPAGESVVTPRSHCRSCGRTLVWWENVPLVSWLALRGRCRTCGVWIGWRYPAVELGVGALWGYAVWSGLNSQFLFFPELLVARTIGNCVLFWLLLALAFLDAEHLWLPDRLTLTGIALGLANVIFPFILASRIFITGHGFFYASGMMLAGIAIPTLLVLLIRWTYKLIREREGMGLGDAKLMAMLGAWLGLSGALLSFGIGILLGAVVGVVLLARAGRGKLREGAAMKLPFGTFLCIGGIISALWGQPLINAYLHLIGF